MLDVVKTYVNELQPNDQIVTVFLCQNKGSFTGKTGLPYLALTLVDKTGSVDAKVWDNVESLSGQFEEGDYVKVKATVTTYNGKLQMRVGNIRRISADDVDPADFMPTSSFGTKQMLAELRGLIEPLPNEDIRRLILSFLDDEDFLKKYVRAPAAKAIHHPFLGGLLEHTLSLAKLGKLVCGHYPQVDESMLLAGIFFHDLGKVRELEYERTLGYTDEGRLIGHITIGVEMLNDRIRELGDFPEDLKMLITHMILAHHGMLEFGSPKRPKIMEAMVLSALDDMDARIYSFQAILDEETSNDRWSNYQKMYNRYLYRWSGPAKRDDNGEAPAPVASAATPKPEAAPPGRKRPRPTDKPAPKGGFTNSIRFSGNKSDSESSSETPAASELPLWGKNK